MGSKCSGCRKERSNSLVGNIIKSQRSQATTNKNSVCSEQISKPQRSGFFGRRNTAASPRRISMSESQVESVQRSGSNETIEENIR